MKYIVLLFLFITADLYAYETRAQLVPSTEVERTVYTGDSFKAKLKVWPVKYLDKNLLKKMEGKGFLDFFYILEVGNVYQSKNNVEVTIVELELLLINMFKLGNFYIWNFGDLNIPVDIKKINPQEIKVNQKTPYIFEPTISKEKKFLLWILGSIALLLILIIMFGKRKKVAVEKSSKRDRKYWLDKLIKAKNRDDFEYIYKNRKEVKKLVGIKNTESFYNSLNEYQYKKDWSLDELLEVKSDYKKITFSEGNGI